MIIDADLKSLVEVYAKFDQERGIYINKNEHIASLDDLGPLDHRVTEPNSENGSHIGQSIYPSLVVEQESLTSNNLNEEQLFNLDRSFHLLLNQGLLHDGAEKERIEENYNKLLSFLRARLLYRK